MVYLKEVEMKKVGLLKIACLLLIALVLVVICLPLTANADLVYVSACEAEQQEEEAVCEVTYTEEEPLYDCLIDAGFFFDDFRHCPGIVRGKSQVFLSDRRWMGREV